MKSDSLRELTRKQLQLTLKDVALATPSDYKISALVRIADALEEQTEWLRACSDADRKSHAEALAQRDRHHQEFLQLQFNRPRLPHFDVATPPPPAPSAEAIERLIAACEASCPGNCPRPQCAEVRAAIAEVRAALRERREGAKP